MPDCFPNSLPVPTTRLGYAGTNGELAPWENPIRAVTYITYYDLLHVKQCNIYFS